jgi:hypothetical protein
MDLPNELAKPLHVAAPGCGRTPWLNHGASRTRTGDLLGAITPQRPEVRRIPLAQAFLSWLRSVRFSQFGSTVGRTLNNVAGCRNCSLASSRDGRLFARDSRLRVTRSNGFFPRLAFPSHRPPARRACVYDDAPFGVRAPFLADRAPALESRSLKGRSKRRPRSSALGAWDRTDARKGEVAARGE